MAKKRKNRKNKDKAARTEKKVRNAIIYFLRSSPKRSFNHKQIASGANLRGSVSHKHLVQVLDDLVEAGKINSAGRGKYKLHLRTLHKVGRLEVAKDGFGFVIIEGEEDDIFIGARSMSNALHGDTVKIKIVRSKRAQSRAEGEVVEIVERGSTQFIGTISVVGRTTFMVPDDHRVNQDFYIPPGADKDAKDGDKVVVKLTGWARRSPEAEVVRVLGRSGENNAEMHAILFQFGFDPEFPPEVEAEAEKISKKIPAAEIAKRRDMRAITTFTIDPIDAKDFDDALSFRELENGHFEIGVHIADVSHYVRPNTALDKEAWRRATSVYLVDRTVPMLPEKLSNDVCSLRPNEDRLTFSAVFEMTPRGKLVDQWFGKTVIHSDRRFHYLEAQAIIDAGEGEYFREISELDRLSKTLRKKRFKNGSINFEEDEVRFELDESGKPIRVYRKVRKDTHKMIEDWMLLANRRVAEHVAKLRRNPELAFVYRIHDLPDEEKLGKLRQFVATLGYNLELSAPDAIQSSLNALMTDVIGKPEQDMVQSVAVRAMAKAVYSIENIGHYGLGFRFYSHFTSPIRRYPDMMVHRLLEQYINKDYSADRAALEVSCKHSSNMEKKAVEAERASIKLKQVEWLEDKIGQEFSGIVSGVTRWGLYVELEDSKSEGMVSVNDLDDDYYEVDEDNYCIRGRNNGKIIRLGDRVLIEVKDVNLHRRQIDFILHEVLESRIADHLGVVLSSSEKARLEKQKKKART